MNIFFDINADGTVVMLITNDAKVSAQTECIMFISEGKIVSEMRLPKFIKKLIP
jgi:putative ABC transport system ATP-binding protein